MGRRNAIKDPLNASFGYFLSSRRKKLKLSQHEVSKRLGLSRAFYSELERGIYKIPLTDFVRFSKEYAPEIIKKLPKELKKMVYIMLTFRFWYSRCIQPLLNLCFPVTYHYPSSSEN